MKTDAKYKSRLVEQDPFVIDLNADKESHKHPHLALEQHQEHGVLPPPPSKAFRIPPKPQKPMPHAALHHVHPILRMMPIKSRLRS